MTEPDEVYESACSNCGKVMEVEQYGKVDNDDVRFEGGCYLAAFPVGHELNSRDDRPVFYQECEECCPLCGNEPVIDQTRIEEAIEERRDWLRDRMKSAQSKGDMDEFGKWDDQRQRLYRFKHYLELKDDFEKDTTLV